MTRLYNNGYETEKPMSSLKATAYFVVASFVLAGILRLFINFAYVENPNAPTQSYTCTVIKLSNQIVSNTWNGTRGYCSLTVQLKDGGQVTLAPYWEDCLLVAEGDNIKIWRQQYSLDMKGQWKPWQIVPSSENLKGKKEDFNNANSRRN